MKLLKRIKYLSMLRNVKGTPDIKVITGIRRAGKSKLLESFIEEIKECESNYNLIQINFNLLEFDNLLEYHALHNYIQSSYQQGKTNYVFIDEVQMCEGFEKAINSLHASEKFDIYITGSNAFLMSSDLATLFTGRTFQIEVFPFSFKEFCEYFKQENRNVDFSDYVKEGGMPGAFLYSNLKDKYNYLNNEVFNALVIRDILNMYKIRNYQGFHKLTNYLMDNIGNITSVRNIEKVFNSENSKLTNKTIASYVDYLLKAYAFFCIPRYDIQGKQYLRAQNKYYLTDSSFRYANLGQKNMNYGRTLENIIAIELLRRKYELYSGTLYKKEIDFVALKTNEKLYIQVSEDISNNETFQREVSPLLKIKDAYPKILITHTHQPSIYEGIKILDVKDFLLNDEEE